MSSCYPKMMQIGSSQNGFLLDQGLSPRSIQILVERRGWIELLDHFNSDEVGGMERYPGRFMVLLMDFDGRERRLNAAKARIPPSVEDRVFVLGVLTEPEALRRELGSYESIGLGLARDCREGTETIWEHALLRHNASELGRLRESVTSILFPPGRM